MVHPRIEVYSGEKRGEIPLDWVHRTSEEVLSGENWKGNGILSIVLGDDTMLKELNRRFLKKNRPTDVIAFPLGDGGEEEVWGEVYVSIERAREQALIYHVSFNEELARLIIHGVLHLLGYDDKDESSKKEMRAKEDYYLGEIEKFKDQICHCER